MASDLKTKGIPFKGKKMLSWADSAEYALGRNPNFPDRWVPLEEFKAPYDLRFLRFERGRSSVLAWMVDLAGTEYPVTLHEFEKILPRMFAGRIELRRRPFVICSVAKKGSAYTLTFKVPE